MPNKSSLCYQCRKNGKIPISYRDENRVFLVAFYVCSECMHFSGFIDTWKRKSRRIMPFFDDMNSLIRMRYVKNRTLSRKIHFMRKDPYSNCFKSKKHEIFKLFARNRNEKTYEFIGYVCKNCRVGYFVKNKSIEFRTLNPKGYYNNDGSLPNFYSIPFNEYMGFFATQIAEDEEKPIDEQVTITIKKKDLAKLKKSKIKFTTV